MSLSLLISTLVINIEYCRSVPSTLPPIQNFTTSSTTLSSTISSTTWLNLTAICIVSKIQTAINGRYVYDTWENKDNGPIFYNSVRDTYLYPHIWSETGNKRYYIGPNISSTAIHAYCKIPTSSNPMSPYDCYNDDGHQLISTVSSEWIQDDATLSSCPVPTIYPFTSCGSNKFCYNTSISASTTNITTNEIFIGTTLINTMTYHEIHTQILNHSCFNASISISFEEIDFTTTTSEYFNVFDHNGSLISRCDGNLDYGCNNWIECINSYQLGVDRIKKEILILSRYKDLILNILFSSYKSNI